jgi:hypothetical protein
VIRYYYGLDLGQAQDPTAIAILEAPEPPRPVPGDAFLASLVTGAPAAPKPKPPAPVFNLRHLERIKLGTPYPKVVERVKSDLARAPLHRQAELVVDGTGVGRPVVDLLRDAGLKPLAVSITGGETTTNDGDNYRVPKRDLVVGVQVLLQQGRLKIAKGLPDTETLIRELLAFKAKVDPTTAHDSYNAREGAHDDLVLAVALAVWRATSSANRLTGAARFKASASW